MVNHIILYILIFVSYVLMMTINVILHRLCCQLLASTPGGCCNIYDTSLKPTFDSNLAKSHLFITYSQLPNHFYPRPVLAFGYCRCLRLCVRVFVCVYQSWACPHDNSPLVQARITKFGTKVQKTLVKVPIVFWHDRPWPSRSNLTWKSNFTSFLACPPHNSSAVEARITKFGRLMHLSTVKIHINFGLDWFWSSPSFSILKPIFLPNLFALFLYYI